MGRSWGAGNEPLTAGSEVASGGSGYMGSTAWSFFIFVLLACVMPVHALIVSARRGRTDFKAEAARREGRAIDQQRDRPSNRPEWP